MTVPGSEMGDYALVLFLAVIGLLALALMRALTRPPRQEPEAFYDRDKRLPAKRRLREVGAALDAERPHSGDEPVDHLINL